MRELWNICSISVIVLSAVSGGAFKSSALRILASFLQFSLLRSIYLYPSYRWKLQVNIFPGESCYLRMRSIRSLLALRSASLFIDPFSVKEKWRHTLRKQVSCLLCIFAQLLGKQREIDIRKLTRNAHSGKFFLRICVWNNNMFNILYIGDRSTAMRAL